MNEEDALTSTNDGEPEEDAYNENGECSSNNCFTGNFESVIAQMGPPGPYQFLQIFMISTCIMPQAFITLNYVFIGIYPSFECSEVNETELFEKYHLLNDSDSYDILYETCKIRVTSNVSGTREDIIVSGCIDGYNYTGGRGVSFIAEWDLVCESGGLGELAQTVIPFGWIFGIILTSILTDRYGRKRMMTVSIFLTVISELCVSFSPNIYTLIALRFLSGFFSSGMGAAGFVLCSELLVSKSREHYGMIAGAIWSFYTILLCAIAYIFKNIGWRYLQMCTAIVGAFPILFIYFVNESSLWLHSIGDFPRATVIVKKACKINGIDFTTVRGTLSQICTGHIKQIQQNANDTLPKYNVLDIFRKRKLLVISSISWLAWFANDITYYGMYLTASTLVGDLYINMTLMALLEIPGCYINFIILKYKGRRFVITLFLTMSVICLFVSTCFVAFGVGTNLETQFSAAFFFIGKFAISCSYNTLYMYTPEIFPTAIRSTGVGICSACSCLGGMVAPFLLPLFSIAAWAPGTVLLSLCFVTLILFPKLPETKGKQLPSRIGE